MGGAVAILKLQRAGNALPVMAEFCTGSSISIGSAQGSQILLEEDGVHPQHARMHWENNGAWIAPLDGALVLLNGCALRGPTRVREGDWLMLGATLYVVGIGSPTGITQATMSAQSRDHRRAVSIGRLPECEICINSPVISRHHARLLTIGDTVWLEDLASTNGTFVDGQQIKGRAPLADGARVLFADAVYAFKDGVLYPEGTSPGVRLTVRGLGKILFDKGTRRPRALLKDVNLVIEPGEFVAIVGSSGSGKSTLLDALSGRRRPTEGTVLYNGLELYSHYDVLRSSIGYVPQQDIVHRRISVGRALAYAARLRLPNDMSRSEIDHHVSRVLEHVALLDKAEAQIDTPSPLSGGQLRRVSLAVELIADPGVLFLDEATTGLDPASDKRMMRLFADLAAGHKTVVCVTHSLENVDFCGLVVLLHRGHVIYTGSIRDALTYFGVRRLAEVYEILEAAEPEEWARRFVASEPYQRWVEKRLHRDGASDPPQTVAAGRKGKRRSNCLRQTAILTRRFIDLILADRRNLTILLVQAPLIGILIGVAFRVEEGGQRTLTEPQVAFALVISAIWFGCLNSVREIVKELPIWQREHAVNLNPLAYLVSKLMPLAAISGMQVAGLMVAATALLDLQANPWAQAGVLWFAALTSTGLGLLTSALATTSDKAVASVPLLVVPQVILSGALVPLGGASELIAMVGTISFWAFDAMKNLLRMSFDHAGPSVLPLALNSDLQTDLGAMAAMFTVFMAGAWWVLRRGGAK